MTGAAQDDYADMPRLEGESDDEDFYPTGGEPTLRVSGPEGMDTAVTVTDPVIHPPTVDEAPFSRQVTASEPESEASRQSSYRPLTGHRLLLAAYGYTTAPASRHELRHGRRHHFSTTSL